MAGYDDLPAELRAVVAGACHTMLCDWFGACVAKGIPLERIRRGTMLADINEIRQTRGRAGLELDPFTMQLLEAASPKDDKGKDTTK